MTTTFYFWGIVLGIVGGTAATGLRNDHRTHLIALFAISAVVNFVSYARWYG
jgi:hypothetical protein